MEKEQNPSRVICKSNALIEARYRLSLTEHRIILYCISQVRRDEPISDDRLYVVSAQEFARMHGITRQTAYQELKEASNRLYERTVTVESGPNGNEKPRDSRFRFIQRADYMDKDGEVHLRFSKDILPYLSELKGCFTRYFHDDVSQLRSPYAIRLYEMIMQWRSARHVQVSVDDLKNKMKVEKDYRIYADFRRTVIDRPLQQINEFTPMWCQCEAIKRGRKITHLLFTFGEKAERQDRKRMAKSRKTPSAADIQAAARPGESEQAVRDRLRAERDPRRDAHGLAQLAHIKDLLAGVDGGLDEPH